MMKMECFALIKVYEMLHIEYFIHKHFPPRAATNKNQIWKYAKYDF